MLVMDRLAGCFLLVVLISTAYYLGSKKRHVSLPPGPKGLPLVGNLFQMPRFCEWEIFHEWSQLIETDILYLSVAGTEIVVLDTYDAMSSLFEKKSSVYSSRPRLPMVRELMGWEFNFGFKDYGDAWRHYRRIFHREFHIDAVERYRPYQLQGARKLLQRLLRDQNDLMGQLRLHSSILTMAIAYGFNVTSKDDPYILLSERAIRPSVEALNPGAFLVDSFPVLKHIPSWFPGAGFKRKAKVWRQNLMEFVNTPFDEVRRQMAEGVARPSFCFYGLNRLADGSDSLIKDLDDVKLVAAAMYTGGVDTTVASISTCLLILLNHQDILKKAQSELDSVLGVGNLPRFEDEPVLPYTTAVIKECFRWRNITPLALPHVSSEEDRYKGFRIPKGAIVFANAWAILRDENIYKEASKFNPDRFLTPDGSKIDKTVPDPDIAMWGFGRRICPGRHLAKASIWITVSSLMAAFHMERVDETGGLEHLYHPGGIQTPKDFGCSFTPRSAAVEKLLNEASLDDQ